MPMEGDHFRMRLGRLVSRISRHWRAELDRRLQDTEVTEATLVPLVQLACSDRPMRQKDLAEALALDCSSLVRVIGNLQAAGLIRRQRDPADRRSHTLTVTNRGHDTVSRIVAVSYALEDRLLDGIDPEDVKATARVLNHVSEQLIGIRNAARMAATQTLDQRLGGETAMDTRHAIKP